MTASMTLTDPNAASAGDGIFGLDCAPEQAAVVLVPVPFDATTSYRAGTAGGPAAILAASGQVDLHDREVGDPWRAGIALLPEDPAIATRAGEARRLVNALRDGESGDPAGELEVVNRLCGEVNDTVRDTVSRWLRAGRIVGTVGGDHATAFGAIAAHAAHYGEIGLLHIDAHADLRRDYEGFRWSHASVMEAVCRELPGVTRLVQVGVRDFCEEEAQRIDESAGRIVTFFDADLQARLAAGEPWAALVEEMLAPLPRTVYLSFDIDGLDPALGPHTGTPVPGGLNFAQACFLLRSLAQSGRRLVGFDLVEVAPGPDGDEWDGNVGARLLYKLIGHALATRAVDPGTP
jgi:agmatinase